MAERWAAERLGAYARIRRHEAAMQAAATRALSRLVQSAGATLKAGGYDVAALGGGSGVDPVWQAQLEEHINPAVTAAYVDSMRAMAREGVSVDAAPYAARHLESVHSRLVGVPDQVFDVMREELRDGMLAGDDVRQLSARVDGLLSDGQRWRNRATVIARTEVIGANNSGGYDAAGATAAALGVDPSQVFKEWLSTPGTRTRPSHQPGKVAGVLGLTTPFLVGSSQLDYPGMPGGPAREVVQCRCSVQYLMPGDPGYPEEYAAAVAPPPLAPAGDLTRLDASVLDNEMTGLMEAGDYGPRFAALVAEMDRRDSSPVPIELSAAPDPVAEQAALNRVLFGSEEPGRYVPKRSSKDAYWRTEEQVRDEYDTWHYTQWLRAEEECRGVMLSAEGVRAGVDVADLFTRRKRSLRYASQELQEWFAQPGNERMSYTEFRAGLRDDAAARRANTNRRNRGWESEWG